MLQHTEDITFALNAYWQEKDIGMERKTLCHDVESLGLLICLQMGCGETCKSLSPTCTSGHMPECRESTFLQFMKQSISNKMQQSIWKMF